MDGITIKKYQEYVKKKDFNIENKDRYFIKFMEEVGELAGL